jgi:V/A-type H+-transporting ATPase subunit E
MVMQDNKLAQLTEKLYGEGVEKGRRQAEEIVAKAQAEAKSIVEKAQTDAKKILEKAQKDADVAKSAANEEIIQAGKNTISSVKLGLEKLLASDVITESTSKAFVDVDFVKSLITTAVSNFKADADHVDLQVLLPADKQVEFEKRAENNIKSLLDKGLVLRFESSVKSGFKVAPKDGSYYITFTEQDFNNLFKEYLRPKVRALLFEE